MATVRDMINANLVVTKLANNPNVFVTTSFKFLPILGFLTKVVEDYLKVKEAVIAGDTTAAEKEEELNKHLDSDITLPEVTVGINTLRNCGLTMIDIQHISWWLVEFEEEYEDE